MNKENDYFGSVKFFKHLLLALVIIMIALPTIFAIIYKNKYTSLKKQVEDGSLRTENSGDNAVGAGENSGNQENAEETEAKARVITITGANGETITMVVDDESTEN